MWQLMTTNELFMLQTLLIFDEQGQTAICHSSEDQLLHHKDVKRRKSICGDKLHGKS
jgi:hypothetical protein